MIESISLFIFGAILGSFAVATVWRLRAKQLASEKSTSKQAEKLVKKQHLDKTKINKDYSRCLNCSHRLAWYDLIPIFSWLSLRGRCRYCRSKIGWTELVTEIVLASLFTISYSILKPTFRPALLIIWLIGLVILTILFIYDLRWMVMPNSALYSWVGLTLIYAALKLFLNNFSLGLISEILWSVIILAGIYGILWLMSKGKWIGSGDIYLGFGMGLVLADWRLALISLFLANFIGTIIVLPSLVSKKRSLQVKLPLGPLLIAGFVIVFLAQGCIRSMVYYLY